MDIPLVAFSQSFEIKAIKSNRKKDIPKRRRNQGTIVVKYSLIDENEINIIPKIIEIVESIHLFPPRIFPFVSIA